MRAKRASGSRPAGCIVEAGLWWWRRTMPVVSGKISAKNWEFESRSAVRWNGPGQHWTVEKSTLFGATWVNDHPHMGHCVATCKHKDIHDESVIRSG
jgi:hypothetical protein